MHTLILKAVKDFLRFLSFSSKYFSIPNLFLTSLYVLNFDIFSSDSIRCSQNCSYLSFNLFLYTMNSEAELKVLWFSQICENPKSHKSVFFLQNSTTGCFELLHCSRYALLTSELLLDCTICNQKFIQLTKADNT